MAKGSWLFVCMCVAFVIVVTPAFAARALSSSELSGTLGEGNDQRCVTVGCGTGQFGRCMLTDPACTDHNQCGGWGWECVAKNINEQYGECRPGYPGEDCQAGEQWCIKYGAGNLEFSVCNCGLCLETRQDGCIVPEPPPPPPPPPGP
jgi:hypothetical protein